LKTQKLIENLLITDIADKGQALGKADDKVVFVDKAIPGDVVDVLITRSRKNYLEGKVKALKVPSSYRTTPFCSHFGVCGGCKWQDMDYQHQLVFKQKQVADAMKRIAKAGDLEISDIIAAPATTYYRNKLEYTFSDRRWLPKEEMDDKSIIAGKGLGFHIPGRFDKILDIRECFLQKDPSNSIRLHVKAFSEKMDYDYFDPVEQKGFLRNMIIRTSTIGEIMVIVIFKYRDDDKINALLGNLRDSFPEITALLYVINGKKNDTISDLPAVHFSGNAFIMESMEGLKFKIGPKSFYQTNAEQAYNLYCITREFAGLTGSETVYDLYTGTGTIANFIASKAKMVIGVEYVEEAILDARENSEINNITNTRFFAGDMKDVLTPSFFNAHGKPDVIIADPPRAGFQAPVAENLLHSGATTIVYVSCNPATQARDMLLLSPLYEALRCQPVDMFPHTHHVENVVLLKRKE
jgi:23S rRNA (uracil1939-C5)-methyltransferase